MEFTKKLRVDIKAIRDMLHTQNIYAK